MKIFSEKEFEKENVFGKGVPNDAYAKYFIGHSFLNVLPENGASPLHLTNVTFEPGCRNNWHIHHAKSGGGQILICTAGEGWYQEEGKEPVSLTPGMVIVIPPEVKHWHGAKKDSWFSHISLEVPGEGTSTEWKEPVSDEEYDKLKEEKRKTKMKKMLVVYYSWSNGNTKQIAEALAAKTRADVERIDTVTPYSGTYEEVVDQGQKEVNEGYLPPLKPLKVNLKDYDVVAVGTPTWWYTMAPAVHTFLAENDFSGKTVIPFMTNAGWPGHVIPDMKKAVKSGTALLPMKIQFDSQGGSTMVTKERDVEAWMESVKDYLSK